VQKIKRWKPMSKRPIGRPKTRWEDDVLEDIKSINISIWKKVAQNRQSWKKVVEQDRTLYIGCSALEEEKEEEEDDDDDDDEEEEEEEESG